MAHYARTWRPRSFQDVVGQELTIRLLRNSLYEDRLFPVYLFAGQRGCGKTTLARIFAMAVNCAQLREFRQRPHEVLFPCGTCVSCVALVQGVHTDFIEIDGASHTGVDNVRSIIEAMTFAPQMGTTKVYLIDEVHMLSKAAFNALLKTFEEPLDTVIFLLATTEIHKIPDTIRSRCFQLFLDPLTPTVIETYLARICAGEQIPHDAGGLARVAQVAEGSLRDAINHLERVYIAYGKVTESEVASLYRLLPAEDGIKLLMAIARYDLATALQLVRSTCYERIGASVLIRSLCAIMRQLVSHKYGISTQEAVPEGIEELAAAYTLDRVVTTLGMIVEAEPLLRTSAEPYAVLELLLMRLCKQHEGGRGQIGSTAPAAEPVREGAVPVQPLPTVSQESRVLQVPNEPVRNSIDVQAWLQTIKDPLSASLARQGAFRKIDIEQGVVEFALPESLSSLGSMVDDLQRSGHAFLTQACKKQIVFRVYFEEQMASTAPQHRVPPRAVAMQPVAAHSAARERVVPRPAVAAEVDAAPKILDPITDKILRMFPGSVQRGGEV